MAALGHLAVARLATWPPRPRPAAAPPGRRERAGLDGSAGPVPERGGQLAHADVANWHATPNGDPRATAAAPLSAPRDGGVREAPAEVRPWLRCPSTRGMEDDEADVAAAARGGARRCAAAHRAVAPAAATTRHAVPDRDPHPAALPQPLRPGAAARPRLEDGDRGLPLRAQPAPLGRPGRGGGRAAPRPQPPRGQRAAARPRRRVRRRALPEPAGRRVAPVPGPRLGHPRQGSGAVAQDQAPARAGRRLAPRRGRRHGRCPVAAERGPADTGGAAGLRQQRHALVGREPDLRDHGGARPVAARVRGGAAPADRGRRPPARPRHGRPPERRHQQLVDRPVAAPLALRQGAQRHLRAAGRRLSAPHRRPALRRGPARQLRGDGQDPHGRVDARRAPPPHHPRRDARQLVRDAGAAGLAPAAPPDAPGLPDRHPRLAARRPRGALRADGGVRRRLPHAPADPRRAAHRQRAGRGEARRPQPRRAPGPGRAGRGGPVPGVRPGGVVRRGPGGADPPAQLPRHAAEPAPRRGRRRPRRRAPHRPGDHRPPARPRARRAALQRLPPHAPPAAGGELRGAHRRRRRGGGAAARTSTAATSTAWT